MRRIWYFLLVIFIMVGCAPVGDALPTLAPRATITPQPPTTLHASLTGIEGVSGKRVALCTVQGSGINFPLTCTLTGAVATADDNGDFTFEEISAADYALLVESGLGDFDAAVQALTGQTIIAGDWAWAQAHLFEGAETVPLNMPALPVGLHLNPTDYALNTLQLGGSPFVVAHSIEQRDTVTIVQPIVLDARRDTRPALPITQPRAPDIAALREDIGPLTPEENNLVALEVRERWAAFQNGDDSAFRDTDARLISGLRSGAIHTIGGTVLTTQEVSEGDLVKRVTYVASQEGVPTVVAWDDGEAVTEAMTGYRLNVLDDTGEWTSEGPNGEQFYHYGWSYLRRWGRVLPDPVIDMVNAFYNDAPGHVRNFEVDYQLALESFGGDMSLIMWDTSLPNRIRRFEPQTQRAPTLTLPDSGTIDVRRERFREAVDTGQVRIDEASVRRFVNTPEAINNTYIEYVTDQIVYDALLFPYRNASVYNDMEAAIILSATYGGSGPLTITISDRLRAGYQVPRREENLVRISPNEVANVILGYGGALNAKWPHEMSHIVEFRSPLYEFQRQDGGLSACEPLKYMMEFMWWVERYPYDAPDTDWMPIGSGLTLARLLTDTYPNSGC